MIERNPKQNDRIDKLKAAMEIASIGFDAAGKQLVAKYRTEKRELMAARLLEGLDLLSRSSIRQVVASLLFVLSSTEGSPVMIVDPNQQMVLVAVLGAVLDLVAVQDDNIKAAIRDGKQVQ